MQPESLHWSIDNCTVGRAMDILGERWTVVVLREIMSGIHRFDDMRVRTSIPRQVLTNRLATLVEAGVIRRVPYQEPGARQRHEYRPTPMGLDLWPIFVALLGWGNRYLADPEGAPLAVVHRGCGAEVGSVLACTAGHPVTASRDVLPAPGPGAHRRTFPVSQLCETATRNVRSASVSGDAPRGAEGR